MDTLGQTFIRYLACVCINRPYGIPSCITHRPLPTYIEIGRNFFRKSPLRFWSSSESRDTKTRTNIISFLTWFLPSFYLTDASCVFIFMCSMKLFSHLLQPPHPHCTIIFILLILGQQLCYLHVNAVSRTATQ